MWVSIRAPDDWRVEREGKWTIATSPDGELRVEASPLVGPSGFDPRQVFERGVAKPRLVQYLQFLDNVTTTDGWPMRLVTLRIGDDGPVRLGAVYEMLCYRGAAVAIAPDAARYDRGRPTLLEVLRSARPIIKSTKPVCVHDYWATDAT